MTHAPIVFVDVETTGFSARDGRVIEVGVLRVENGVIVERLSELIDPGMDVSWQTTRVTGIKNEDVFGKPQFRSIIDRLEELFSGATFAAHNVDFDYSFLREEFTRAGARLSMDRFCTAKLSRKLYPEHRRHNLDSVIERHGYNVMKRHRALYDAEVIAKFFIDHMATDHDKMFIQLNAIMSRTNFNKKPTLRYEPLF